MPGFVAVQAPLQFGQRLRFDRLPAGGQHVVQSGGRGDAVNHRFGGGADGGVAIHLPEQEVVRTLQVVMHGGVQLDHVLIAGEHERFLRPALKAAGAVLHVPLVSGGLGAEAIGPELERKPISTTRTRCAWMRVSRSTGQGSL